MIFKNATQFSMYIEQTVIREGITHCSAILQYCEDNFIDPGDIRSLITSTLKDKIANNMRDLGLLPQVSSIDFSEFSK